MPKFAFFRGQIVPLEDARVGVMTHALHYGTGCFEGIRAYWNEDEQQLLVFQLEAHYKRLRRSAHILYMELAYTTAQLCQVTLDLLRQEGYRQDVYIRPLVYTADEVIGVRLHDLQHDVAIVALPFGRYIDKEEGAHTCVSAWRRIDDNAVPARAKLTGAYVNSALAKTEAMRNGFDEAIVLTDEGHVSEGSAENLFIVRDGVLITPPITDNILEGITRNVMMQLARDELGLKVVERSIDRTELYVADEAFLCGTGVQVAAVTRVDHRAIGAGLMGPVVTSLRDLYFDVVRGKNARYRDWCTPVY